MKHMKNDQRVIVLNRIIFILSLIGVLMATYVLQSWIRHASIVCLTGGGCTLVAKSRYSYPFGIPVPAVGLAGYTMLTILTFLRTMNEGLRTKLLPWVIGMGLFGVCFVSWFTYTELFLIKGVCTWCAVSAVNMVIIFLLAVISSHMQKRIA